MYASLSRIANFFEVEVITYGLVYLSVPDIVHVHEMTLKVITDKTYEVRGVVSIFIGLEQEEANIAASQLSGRGSSGFDSPVSELIFSFPKFDIPCKVNNDTCIVFYCLYASFHVFMSIIVSSKSPSTITLIILLL